MVVGQVFDRLEKASGVQEEFHRRTNELLTAGTQNEQLVFRLLRYVVHAAESQTRLLTRGEQIIVQLRLYRLEVLHEVLDLKQMIDRSLTCIRRRKFEQCTWRVDK